ncbi:hypothetical protein NBO_893g0001 [Nosema bombycis CQ1]|uniref:Uncharacterized protein n=1 Tax=Nosema bombycis (strain CQ1 / CVCC 102059) TaxID=578461 RepID=R0KM89_NOSB1|nr:hypothetical protein NBO_893g0001 [Nosema bombycis CQ1]|eukprot:EOB11766.1 hypothetical protein NBO_893g0001 [Nosema bombycis CQ1]
MVFILRIKGSIIILAYIFIIFIAYVFIMSKVIFTITVFRIFNHLGGLKKLFDN